MISDKEIAAAATFQDEDGKSYTDSSIIFGAQWLRSELLKRSERGVDSAIARFKTYYREELKIELAGDGEDIFRQGYRQGQVSQVATVEQLREELAKKDERIKELDQIGFELSAYQCVHPEALTVREGQDGVSCAKQEYITKLEDAVLLAYEMPHLSTLKNFDLVNSIKQKREKA